MYCGLLVLDTEEHIRTVHNERSENVSDFDASTFGEKKHYPVKSHYCLYCKSFQSKLARHLERKHKHEINVQMAIALPKGSKRRKQCFAELQKKGDFLYNSTNTHEEYVVVRRSFIKGISPTSRIPCPHCKGFYSKKNIRNHVRLNCGKQLTGNVQLLSRAVLPQIHEKASKILRETVFPPMRNDEITRVIAYDDLVITYANLLVMKYSASSHHYKMIRNKMRHIGRILLEMRKLNSSVTNVTSIYEPSHFDTLVEAIHKIGGLHEGKFETPSFGPSSVTLLSHIGDILQTEAIKQENDALEKNTLRFLKLLTTSANSLINKTAIESRTQNQRSQVVTLPKTEDVRGLFKVIVSEIERNLDILKLEFDLDAWRKLSKTTLVKMMIFNRKRPGDIEKSQIAEYKNLQMVEEELVSKLSASEKEYASKFGRYIARGKLDSPAPILVSDIDMKAIEIILKYRDLANVGEKNLYLFAAPLDSRVPYFSAAAALSELCAANDYTNKNLTATKLRKHLATVTSTLEQTEQAAVSDFMGHNLNIHNKIYRQRPVVHDVIKMGKLLNDAIGFEDIAQSLTGPEKSVINDERPEELIYCNVHSENEIQEMSHIKNSVIDNKTTGTPISRDNRQLNYKIQEMFNETTPTNSDGDEESESEFQPDLSVISERDDDADLNYNKLRTNKKHRSNKHIQMRTIKRKSWTTPEKSTIRQIFANYLNLDNAAVPSLETCQDFIYKNKELANRAPHQVRAWIIYEKNRIKERTRGGTRKHRWTTPERILCRKIFKSYYNTNVYPSTADLQSAINDHVILKNATVPTLKSHLQHDYKYLQKEKREL